MYQADYDEFKKTLSDLCVAVNRPFNDDLARVFWEDLKGAHLSAVKERAKFLRACGKSRFTSQDLKPEPDKPAPVICRSPAEGIDEFDSRGNYCLLRHLLAVKKQPDDTTLRQLVDTKERLVHDFRGMNREVEIEAEEMRLALLAAFGRIAA